MKRKIAIPALVLLPILLGISGCISSSSPPPPEHTTVVVPSNSTVVCQDGSGPPCN